LLARLEFLQACGCQEGILSDSDPRGQI
jgi:hypothetical protein